MELEVEMGVEPVTLVQAPTSSVAQKQSVAAKFSNWVVLYAAYLFLAGFTYLNNYFGVFGLNVSWLDFGFNDTIARGFLVLFGAGFFLSIIYLVVLAIALLIEIILVSSNRLVDTLVAILLIMIFIPTYWISRKAGIDQANTDRGSSTILPTITFVDNGCGYRGKLVYVKGESLFIYNLVTVSNPMPRDKNSQPCPIQPVPGAHSTPEVWMLRTNDLQDVRIIHYEKEAKP